MDLKQNRSALIFTAVVLVITIIVGIIMMVNLTYHKVTNSVRDILTKPYADEKIVDYVKREHDINVTVIKNEGPSHISTGEGGFAVVQSEDGFEFNVFINSFGKLVGDNYLFKQVETDVEDWIIATKDKEIAKSDTFTSLILSTNEWEELFTINLQVDPTIQVEDPQFMTDLYDIYGVLRKWSKTLEDTYGFPLSNILIDTEVGIFMMIIDDSYDTYEKFEKAFIKQNEAIIFPLYNKAAIDYAAEIDSLLPEQLTMMTYRPAETISCYTYEAIDKCSSFKITVELETNGDYDLLAMYESENDEMRQIIFQAITNLKKAEIPIGALVLDDFGVPKEYIDELKYISVTIEDIETIEKPEDIQYKY